MGHGIVLDRLTARWPVSSVIERDLELVLLNEIHSSIRYRKFLIERLLAYEDQHDFVGAWRQIGSFAITDTIMIIEASSERVGCFFEYKVNHSEQPEQGARYKIEGNAGVRDGSWQRFKTCIIAPKARLRSLDISAWDCIIAVEDIRAWMASHNDASAITLSVLDAAVSKFQDGGPPRDEEVTSFFEHYRDLCDREFTDLRAKRSTKGWLGNVWHNWVYFCDPVEPNPKLVHLYHQPSKGCVDLYISNSSPPDVRLAIGRVIPDDSRIEKAGKKSTVIRYTVPKIDQKKSFTQQESKVRVALDRAKVLLDFWRQHKGMLGFDDRRNC